MKKVGGIVVCSTPFDQKGRLDEESLRQHLRRLHAAGVMGVYMGAPGAGETHAMTPDERDRMLEIAVEELKGKIEVRSMGWEPRLIEEMVEFVRRTQKLKPDAIIILSMDMGHKVKPTRGELEQYYLRVLEETSIPIVLHTSHMVGYFLPLDLIEELKKRFPNIMGMVYGGTDTNYLADLMNRFSDHLEIHCASPQNALNVVALGGNGWEGFEGNFAPGLYAALTTAFRENDARKIRHYFTKLMALNTLLANYGGPSSMRGIKPLMNAFGFPGAGLLRSPRQPIDSVELNKLITAILKLDLPDIPKSLPHT